MSRLAIATSLCLAAAAVTAHAQRPNQGEDESAAFVEEGRGALKRGKLDEAARSLDQAISLNPRRVEAYVLRSAVYAARRQYKDGIALMQRARALAPEDPEVLVALGTQLLLSGDADTGVPLLQQVVAKEPGRYDAQLLLGEHWYGAGKWSDAIAALEAYFAHRPGELAREDPRHQIDLADAYLRSRQPQKAVALFDAAAKAQKSELRARIGAAWATAAIDCRQARPMLHDLDALAEQHPEIWLVDGQCALALGDPGGALALGRRYLDRSATGSAAGHALVGQALAARGNLVDARRELETARQLEPQRRRWTVQLGSVLRRSGKLAEAIDVLDKLGAPASAQSEPEWWIELGEAMLAHGDTVAAAARLTPELKDLSDDVAFRIVLGAIDLQAGHADDAVDVLDHIPDRAHTPRSRKLLVDALATVGSAKLAAGDAKGAEQPLVQAAAFAAPDHRVVWRDLGIVQLELGKTADAVRTLDHAAEADGSAISLMLSARAHAAAGDVTAARPRYERALAAEKERALEVALDWAASEVAAGDPAIAVAALDRVAGAAKTGPLAARWKTALADARHAAGLAQLRAGNGTKALELLRASAAADSTLATKCDIALAAVVANDLNGALAALRAVQGQSCPFPPPADTQAAPILAAFISGVQPKQAAKALERLTALEGKSTGAASALLGTAIRVVALEAAQEAYRGGQLAQARKYLAIAKSANARVGGDEIAADLAVLDLADGRTADAIAQLERLSAKVPEALVNLGIAYEKLGEQDKALDAWKRAKKIGVRFGPLGDWIDSKERIYGEQP